MPAPERDKTTTGQPTWTFQQRYAEDPEFKAQIDEGRKRVADRRSEAALADALTLSATGRGKKSY